MTDRKMCKRCRVEKGLEHFSAIRRGGRVFPVPYCKPCAVVLTGEHRQRARAALNALKDRPCADCNVTYPSYVMHFDHLNRSEKLGALATMAGRVPMDKLLAEAKKCQVVCANCHAERTHGRK